MTGKTLVEVGEDGVAVVSINNPPLNLLSVDVMLSLKAKLEETLLRADVKAVVITGSKGKFSGGFDVTAFGGSQVKRTRKELGFFSIEFLTDTLEAARKPMVAAVEGMAFGGGLEIALACHARISTCSAQLGLTELQYGILPGFGGTQRLPRLVGLSKSLEMILMSKRVNGEEARSLSLVDAIASADKLLAVARQWALDIYERRKPWIISLYKTEKLEPLREARAILKSARLRIQRESPNLNHPLVCIDVIEMGIVTDPRNALWKEAEALQELRQSSTCRSLIHFFFSQRQISKIPGVSDMNLQPRKIRKVAIVGGGLMSTEIAVMLLLRNYIIILKENNRECLSDEIEKIRGSLQHQLINKKATPEMVENAFNLLEGVLDYKKFQDVDLVIEAESESLSLKQEIFINLEKYCSPHCAFVSNCSKFSLEVIVERTVRIQDRCARMHFFCPSPAMPLLEIVPTKNTIPQVIVNLMDFGRKLKKTSIVIGDGKGYSVNKMIISYFLSAILLANRSVDIYLIDEVLTRFGMQFGPFRMVDMLGVEIFTELCKVFFENFPDVNYKAELISFLRQDNRQGQTNNKRFYKYDNCGNAIPDPEMCKDWCKFQNSTDDYKLNKVPDGVIMEMILFPALNEACRIISEGVVIRSSDLDVASVTGMGFPSYRGGIIFWSDSIGSKHICTRLEKLSEEYGEFYKPCAYLKERASSGLSLANSVRLAKSQL